MSSLIPVSAIKIKLLQPSRWTNLLYLPLLALLAWQLFYWAQLFFTPSHPQPVKTYQSLDADRLLETVRASHLFGTPSSTRAEIESTTSLDLYLHGVFAANGQLPALAIINVEKKGDLPFTKGDNVLPGVTLESVEPDYVILRRSGVAERLALEQKTLPQDLPAQMADQPKEAATEETSSLVNKLGQQPLGNR